MSTEAAPQPPVIPDYELLRLIGRGAYGEVWLARGVTGVHRAVKLVWRDRFPEAGPYEREFHGLKEFAAISLTESRQLALLHVGRDPAAAYFYYVMELADDVTTGRDIDPANYTPHTLKEMRARRGRLPAGECVTLGVELARALSGLHVRGLVHRDIKPSNVIIVGGAPKLADIGLVTEASAALTFVGTEGFVPPEGPGAPGADVFALGKLLYELVTGLDRHDYPRLPPELHAWPDRKEVLELNEVLIRACEPHPDQRHLDAAALLDDLLLLQAGKSVRRLRKAERRLARALRIAALFGLIAGVAGLGAYLERQRANQEMAGRLAAEAERDALVQRRIYANTLGNARSAINREEFGQARQLLGEVVPAAGQADLRGFEWHALRREAQGDPATVLRTDGPAISKLAVSPDESLLAVHDSGGVVALHETATRRELRRFAGVRALGGFSKDGAWLVGSDAAGALQRWRVADGTPGGPARSLPALRIIGPQDTDRIVVLSGTNPVTLVVWDYARQEAVRQLPLAEPATELRWEFFRGGIDAAGTRVAFAWIRGRGSRAEYRLTSVDLRQAEPRVVHTLIPDRPGAVGFDRDGAWAAIDATGEIWRLADRSAAWSRNDAPLLKGIRKMLPGPVAGTAHIAADRDGLYWLDDAGQVVRRGRGHQGVIGDAVALPGSGWVYSASHAGEVRGWSPAADALAVDTTQTWNTRAGFTQAVFSPDNQLIAVPLDGENCGILDAKTLAVRQRIPAMRIPLHWTGTRLTGLAVDAGLVVASTVTGESIERLLTAAAPGLQARLSADGSRVCLTGQDDNLWVETRGTAATVPVARGGYQNRFALEIDATASRLWSAGNDLRLRSQSLSDAAEQWSDLLPAIAPALALMPNGRRLLVPLETGRLQVRDAATGQLLRDLATGGSTPQSIDVSPDGRRVFIAGSKGDVVCLETIDWAPVGIFQLSTHEPLQTLHLAPDQSMLAVITKSGGLHLVRAHP